MEHSSALKVNETDVKETTVNWKKQVARVYIVIKFLS